MSIKIMSAVWDSGPDDRTERLVMLALADHADDEGRCFPSMERIAKKCCMTQRGVRKVVRRLESGGWVTAEIGAGRYGCNAYTLHANPERRSPPERGSPGTGVQEPRNGGSAPPGTVVPPNHHLTIKEPSVRETRARKDEAVAILSEIASPEVAQDFVVHRRGKITTRAAELIVAKLRRFPDADPDAVLLQSIENGWTGIFPEKMRNGGSHAIDHATERSNRRLESWMVGARSF